MEVSVIIPAYNEDKNIIKTLEEVSAYLAEKFSGSWEVIVVDDGSNDATRGLVNEFINKNKAYSIHLLNNGVNMGKGAAVRKGMLTATGNVRLFMDADNATRISEFEKIMPLLKSGWGMVIGSRKLKTSLIKEKQPFLRRFFSKVHHLIVEILLGVSVSDFNCGFKSFSASAARMLFSKQRINGWVFDAELIFLARNNNIAIKEIPVEWEHKATSKVKISRDIINSLKNILIIKLNHLRGFYN